MRSKAYIDQINLQRGNKLTRENRMSRVKTDMLRSIGKQSGESVESVQELKRSAMVSFVQRLLVSSIRQQVAKPQVLMRSQQNCSNQEERRYWIEGDLKQCANYKTIALVSHASKILPRIIVERIFVKTERKLQMNRRGFDKEGGKKLNHEYQNTDAQQP